MSYTDDFYNSLEKKKKNKKDNSASNPKTFSSIRWNETKRVTTKDDDDIAPVSRKSELLKKKEELEDSKVSFWDFAASLLAGPFATEEMKEKRENYVGGHNDYVDRKTREIDKELAELDGTTTKNTTKDGNKDSWVKNGVFDDGYQFGDVTVGTLATAGDAVVGVGKGALKMVEGIFDLGTYGVAAVADLVGADKFAEKAKINAKTNVVDNELKGITDYLDKYSFIGNKGDMISEGLGQVGTIILTGGAATASGLGTAGVTAVTTGATGLSSMGTNMGEAYNSGATDGEAFVYGLTTGSIEAATELLFGGLGKGVKALGISRGIGGLDDMFAKKLSSKIAKSFTNEAVQKAVGNTVEFAVKSSGEGVEEVLSGIGSAVMKKLTYMDDEELSKLIEDENLLEQFVVGTVVSGISQGGDLVKSTKNGTDFVTGYTANEDKVINKIVENEIAEREANGEKLSTKEKNKIYDSVVEKVENGSIGIDTIEEILGGESYETYKKATDENASLKRNLTNSMTLKQVTLQENRATDLQNSKG